MLAGTVGGGGRLDFTVIGDPVNVASRVERLTRRTGDVVLITEATRAALQYSSLKLGARGELQVSGRLRPLRIYAVEPPGVSAPSAGGIAARGYCRRACCGFRPFALRCPQKRHVHPT